jgi:hypothetical protein
VTVFGYRRSQSTTFGWWRKLSVARFSVSSAGGSTGANGVSISRPFES